MEGNYSRPYHRDTENTERIGMVIVENRAGPQFSCFSVNSVPPW